jgi:16S rRNA (cytosine967-C5)-methyltransferase
MTTNLDCRAAAALCLAAVVEGASLAQQLPAIEHKVKEQDRPLLRQLCYGVLRDYHHLAAQARQLLKKPFKTKDRDVEMLILLGGHQLFAMRTPEHAAVSATVGATLALNKGWAKGLVNGVLRQWQRRQDELAQTLTPAQLAAHPTWFYKRLQKFWPGQAAAIIEANNQHPPMTLRVNRIHHSRDAYLELLQQAGIAARAGQFAGDAIYLEQACAVDKLPGFEQGWVSVQDEAPQLSAPLLDLQAGQRVIDTCCAPGGKTCHLLEHQDQLEHVIALDIEGERLLRVQENLERLNLCAEIVCADATDTDSWWDGQMFDRILVDAPCSATGVIRRNPDIKLHRRADDIEALAELQLTMLKALWPTLKPGGKLLYATCSVLPQENTELVQRFCEHQADAEHLAITADWGIEQPYGRQLLPQAGGHDGFFYALLRKVKQ